MNQTNDLFNTFLKKIAYLPAVQEMIEEEDKRTLAEILKERTDRINLLKSIEIQRPEAQANLISAQAELEAAREAAKENVTRHLVLVTSAEKSLSALNGAYNTAAQSLHLEYGEGHITRVLSLLRCLRTELKEKIESLDERMKPEYFANGQWNYRITHPTERQVNERELENLKRKLEATEKSFSSVALLANAEMTPGELKTQVEAWLSAAGYVKDIVKPQL